MRYILQLPIPPGPNSTSILPTPLFPVLVPATLRIHPYPLHSIQQQLTVGRPIIPPAQLDPGSQFQYQKWPQTGGPKPPHRVPPVLQPQAPEYLLPDVDGRSRINVNFSRTKIRAPTGPRLRKTSYEARAHAGGSTTASTYIAQTGPIGASLVYFLFLFLFLFLFPLCFYLHFVLLYIVVILDTCLPIVVLLPAAQNIGV